MKRTGRIALRILVLVVSIGVALLLAEIALRVIGRDSLIDFEPVLRSGPVTYFPNQVSRHHFSDEIGTTITINSMGLRDVEYGDSPRRCTVVALGDSFTEGWGVDLEQTYVKRFERHLAAGTDGLDNVYNAGLNGRNPKNYITLYHEVFQGDKSVELVTMGLFLGNDAVVESTPSYIQPPDRTFGYHVKFFLMRHSALYNLTRRLLRSSTALEGLFVTLGLTNPREMSPNLYRNARTDASWRYTAKLIGEFNASVVDSGRQFLLVLIPPKELVDDGFYRHMLGVTGDDPEDLDLNGFRNRVLEFCSRNELPVLDLTNIFRDASEHPARDFYFKSDDHWNQEGHALAAQAIWEYVQRHDLVPCRQASEDRF